MSSTRIRTIKKIDNYRIFQKWKPSGGVEFARVNLIYGPNGSGKSTFANLLHGCADYATADPQLRVSGTDEVNAGLKLVVAGNADGSTVEIGLDSTEFWGRVRVFNKNFVRRNLAFEAADGPQPQALLTVGEKLADAEEQLKELKPKLQEVNAKIAPAMKDFKSAKNIVDKHLRLVAKKVVEDLRNSPDRRYEGTNIYTKRQVQELLEKNLSSLGDASADVTVDRKVATSATMPPVSLLSRNSLLEREGLDEARSILGTSILGDKSIGTLKGHSDRSRWVQQGIPLHEHLDECLFCGQSLTERRRAELEAHFDESFKNLQAQIDSLVSRIESSVQDSKTYLDQIPSDAAVYDDLKDELNSARGAYREDHHSYRQAAKEIVLALKKKRDNPFSDIVLDSELTLSAPDTRSIERVAAAHAEKISTHNEKACAAARRVELYHIKSSLDEYRRLTSDVERRKNEVKKLEAAVKELEGRIGRLESVGGDPLPGADELTGCVSRLLGRNELKFSISSDGKHYAIERDNLPAINLSEGEQTSIALLYFLASVREDKIKGEPPIVIIDDPVSSMDSSILFGASSKIWAELVANKYVSQVFLMTHNFELFRQWLVQMESVPKNVRKKEGDYKAYEIRATYEVDDGGIMKRRPQLSPWLLDNEKARKLRSQYHFLFFEVANSLLKAGMAEIKQNRIPGFLGWI